MFRYSYTSCHIHCITIVHCHIFSDSNHGNYNKILILLNNHLYSYSFRYLFSLSTVSLALTLNGNLQGISSPPCGKSEEYHLSPLTMHKIELPLFKNSEQILETFLGRCQITTPPFKTATTAYLCDALAGSLSHASSSPTAATHIVWYMW